MSKICEKSNERATKRWDTYAVGAQRSNADSGTKKYFQDIRNYRYGYETPFIPKLLMKDVKDKSVLEIGVGNGIDACELISRGAAYTGLDICKNHLTLTKENLIQQGLTYQQFIEKDLLECSLKEKFDIVYSFGVLHHIEHEKAYLFKINNTLNLNGELRVALYSKYSFFNIYMTATWLVKNRCRMPYKNWQGKLADMSDPESPLTIKIRSKREVISFYKKAGFRLSSYKKRGFVQRYLPIIGKYLKANGVTLNLLGSVFGWYHVCIFKKINTKQENI